MLQALIGIAGLLALAWLFSEARRAIPWRAIVAGLLLQIALAAILLKLPGVNNAFLNLNDLLTSIEKATQAGTALVFGYLGGGPAPFAVTDANATFVLAFRALPIVLLMSALSALLFHWGVLQWVVRGISWVLERAMRVGGATGWSVEERPYFPDAPAIVTPLCPGAAVPLNLAFLKLGIVEHDLHALQKENHILDTANLAGLAPLPAAPGACGADVDSPAGQTCNSYNKYNFIKFPFGMEELERGLYTLKTKGFDPLQAAIGNKDTPNSLIWALHVLTDGAEAQIDSFHQLGSTFLVVTHNIELAEKISDYIGLLFHGYATTHVDALCHVFWEGKMYNGKPSSYVTSIGARSGAVDAWKNGITTRGVLVDIPRFRKEPFVTLEKRFQRLGADVKPVADDEIYAVVRARLFESLTPDNDPEFPRKVAEAYRAMYALHAGEIPAEASKTTYRDQIDGKHWFPVYTRADDVLHFQNGDQRVRMIVRYEDYKQFRATTDIQYGEVVDEKKKDQPNKDEKK